jgi:cation transport ATPase
MKKINLSREKILKIVLLLGGYFFAILDFSFLQKIENILKPLSELSYISFIITNLLIIILLYFYIRISLVFFKKANFKTLKSKIINSFLIISIGFFVGFLTNILIVFSKISFNGV